MPRGYSLLIGLSEVDSTADYYRRRLPGFNGRAGCEGVPKDLELMERLTHYIGYERVTAQPLLNAEANRAKVLAALAQLAHPDSGVQAGDIVFVYFSCHGQTFGEGPTKIAGSPVGNAINVLLLHDRPLVNIELYPYLFPLLLRGVRVVTMFDSCHAGFGSNLSGTEQVNSAFAVFAPLIQEAVTAVTPLLLNLPGIVLPTLLLPGVNLTPATANLIPSQLLQSLARSPRMQIFSTPKAISTRAPGIAHFGAARDEGRAQGGPEGSLFTRVFYRLFLAGGNELTYPKMAAELEHLLTRRPPAFETVRPANTRRGEDVPEAPIFSDQEPTLHIG